MSTTPNDLAGESVADKSVKETAPTMNSAPISNTPITAKPKKNKGILIGIIVAAALVLVGVITAIVLATTKIDYEKIYTASETVNDAGSKFSDAMNDLIYDSLSTDSKIDKAADNARTALKTYTESVEELSKTNPDKDSTLKPLWDKFKAENDKLFPSEAERVINMLAAAKKFSNAAEEFDTSGDMTDKDIDNMVSALTNSGDETLAKFADDFSKIMKEMIAIAKEYEKTGEYDLYYDIIDKQDELYDLMETFQEDLEDSYSVVLDSSFDDYWDDFYEAVYNKHHGIN